MSNLKCGSCFKSNPGLACASCAEGLCKSCARHVEDEALAYIPSLPEAFKASVYCPACYVEHVEPVLARYEQTLEAAREVLVFTSTQGKETRLIKRKEKALKVVDCEDHDQTIMRLAFLAAQGGFNALVDVDVVGRKVKNGSYQTTLFTGVAIPVRVDGRRYGDRSEIKNPN